MKRLEAHRINSPAGTSWRAFVLMAGTLVIGTLGSTLASPLYPLYQIAWNLRTSSITTLYVAYMCGVLASLIFLGRLSSHVGPLKVLRSAFGLLIVALIGSATAPGILELTVSRVFLGIASGMITTAAAVGLSTVEPIRLTRIAAATASITTMAGFGLGPLVGGLVAQFWPQPLVTPYVVVIVPALMVLMALMRLEGAAGPGQTASKMQLKPHFTLPKGAGRSAFMLVSGTTFIAYAVFSLLATLAPSFPRFCSTCCLGRDPRSRVRHSPSCC
jgi:MFS family permease